MTVQDYQVLIGPLSPEEGGGFGATDRRWRRRPRQTSADRAGSNAEAWFHPKHRSTKESGCVKEPGVEFDSLAEHEFGRSPPGRRHGG